VTFASFVVSDKPLISPSAVSESFFNFLHSCVFV